jgi:hypothetical protein
MRHAEDCDRDRPSRFGSCHRRADNRHGHAGRSTLEERRQQSWRRHYRRRMAAVLARPVGADALHLVLARQVGPGSLPVANSGVTAFPRAGGASARATRSRSARSRQRGLLSRSWRAQRESNPCFRRERAASWTARRWARALIEECGSAKQARCYKVGASRWQAREPARPRGKRSNRGMHARHSHPSDRRPGSHAT